MADEVFTGLIRSAADKHEIMAQSREYTSPTFRLEYPPELDPRPIIRCEQQSIFPSCVGNGVTTSGEVSGYLLSGGRFKPQFSRWGSYIWAQKLGGTVGPKQGARLSAAIQASREIGFCTETVWPYPSDNTRYSTQEPADARDIAARNKLQKHVDIQGFQDGFEFMNQGLGSLLIGVDWTSGLRDNKGDVTLADVRGRSLGGHCMVLWGWQSDERLWLINSHGTGWGQQGCRPVRPEVVDFWCQRGEVYGLSDLLSLDVSRPVIVDLGEGM